VRGVCGFQAPPASLDSCQFSMCVDRPTTSTRWFSVAASKEGEYVRLDLPEDKAVTLARDSLEEPTEWLGLGELRVMVTDCEGRSALAVHFTFLYDECEHDYEETGGIAFWASSIHSVPDLPSADGDRWSTISSPQMAGQLLVETDENVAAMVDDGEDLSTQPGKPTAILLRRMMDHM